MNKILNILWYIIWWIFIIWWFTGFSDIWMVLSLLFIILWVLIIPYTKIIIQNILWITIKWRVWWFIYILLFLLIWKFWEDIDLGNNKINIDHNISLNNQVIKSWSIETGNVNTIGNINSWIINNTISININNSKINLEFIVPKKVNLIKKVWNRKLDIKTDPLLAPDIITVDDIQAEFSFWIKNIFTQDIEFKPSYIYFQLWPRDEKYPVRTGRFSYRNIYFDSDDIVNIKPWEIIYFTGKFEDFNSILSWFSIVWPLMTYNYAWDKRERARVFNNQVTYKYTINYDNEWTLTNIVWKDNLDSFWDIIKSP